MSLAIIKYYGDIRYIESVFWDSKVIPLLVGYGIVVASEEQLEEIAQLPEIIYLERSSRVYFDTYLARSASCATSLSYDQKGLTGAGVLIGIVDSGIDIFHPAFQTEEGKSRVRYFWNQTQTQQVETGTVPGEYGFGYEYTDSELNQVIAGIYQIPATDSFRGHGTQVAGVAAGNGADSLEEQNRGIAVDSELIIVKANRDEDGFAGTSQVMMGVDYCIRKAMALQKPIVINLSIGTNLGAHDGSSLVEQYLSDLSGVWKNVIVVAAGNEGDSRHHANVDLSIGETLVTLAVGVNETAAALQLWKHPMDRFEVRITSPSGESIRLEPLPQSQVGVLQTPTDQLTYRYRPVTPFRTMEEYFMELLPNPFFETLTNGLWRFQFRPEQIRTNKTNLWLSTGTGPGSQTGFLQSNPDTTVMIPATARNVIVVGAYDSARESIAQFSGRGWTVDERVVPDLVAPGVDVLTASPGGGYAAKSGTSIAAPFVSGTAALLMEWGLVRGNDSNLYGNRLRVALCQGANPLPFYDIPSVQQGWGRLCVEKTLSIVEKNMI